MGLNLKVRGGTPIHGERSLCFSCRNSQVIQGQAVSGLRVFCQAVYQEPLQMLRPVVECSDWARRTDQSKKDMEKIAWVLETKRGKPIGFVSALEHKWRAKATGL